MLTSCVIKMGSWAIGGICDYLLTKLRYLSMILMIKAIKDAKYICDSRPSEKRLVEMDCEV